jgi:uncharacterized membrane protein
MDLLLVVAANAALIPAVVFTAGPLRIALGLPFLLFSPGYALMAALFPKKGSLDGVQRLALSFGMSIAVVPLIGLILNYTPWGIRLYPILVSVTTFIVATCGVAWFRRKNLAEDERFRASFKLKLPSWEEHSRMDRALSVALALAITAAAISLVHVIATPKEGEQFTEFYVLGADGMAEGYPSELSPGERGEVILGIVNHEQEEMPYRVEVTLDGGDELRLWLAEEEGASAADNTIAVEALAHEEKWEGNVMFEALKAGERLKLEFLLFSPSLRHGHHIASLLDSGNFVDIEVDEGKGEGTITLDKKAGTTHRYRLEVWQGGALRREASFTLGAEEKVEEKFEFPPEESVFRLYEEGEPVIADSGADLSLHLWVDVG